MDTLTVLAIALVLCVSLTLYVSLHYEPHDDGLYPTVFDGPPEQIKKLARIYGGRTKMVYNPDLSITVTTAVYDPEVGTTFVLTETYK